MRERMAVRERVAVRKWYGIVIQNCPARWSAVESVQETATKVAVFCHLLHRYGDTGGFLTNGTVATHSWCPFRVKCYFHFLRLF